MELKPKGTIVFTTVGRPYYGFDIFSTQLNSNSLTNPNPDERRLTDGISVNFNGHFVDDDQTLVYVSERTGSSRIYLNGEPLLPSSISPFHDRPATSNGYLYFIAAATSVDVPFKSCSSLYKVPLISSHDHINPSRLTPYGCADFSPALSQTGKFIAVASYGSRPWPGEFRDLRTGIIIIPVSDPSNRTVVCEHGGWPTWCGDSTLYFHRQADDGWWSIFRLHFSSSDGSFGKLECDMTPQRVTPSGVHCFTPSAVVSGPNNSHIIVVATRRRGKGYRHIEIFDVESKTFYPLTELLNPNLHHYNPFFSPNGSFVGYHRFRGEGADGDVVIPHLEPVLSPIKGLRMLRLNGSFPTFSPAGDLIAFNHDFDSNSGLKVVKSDGSNRWTLFKDRTTFYNSWSPTEEHVIYSSIGPIFDSVKASVQIARISFDPLDLVMDRDEIPVNVKILTSEDSGNNAFPACSPDGKLLVFRSGRNGHKNLYIVDALEGECNGITQLTNGPWIDTMPNWSPDGKLIAFSSNRHNPHNTEAFSIYVIRPDGTGLRRIQVAGTEAGDMDRERINHVCFSDDSQWLLFTANLGGVMAEPVSLPNQFQPYGDLHVVRLDGSGLQRLTWNAYENGTPAWHPSTAIGSGNDNLVELNDRSYSAVGDTLKGQFDEPLWISCDFE